MNLLPRVRYLLEVFLPPGQTNPRLQLLEILTRVAQHSTAAAGKVSEVREREVLNSPCLSPGPGG